MLGEENKALARLFSEEFWNKGNVAAVDELMAAERWTGRGTHREKFQGIAATGRQVTVPGTVFYRFASGKITEFHGQFDGLTLMQQLGVIPDHR